MNYEDQMFMAAKFEGDPETRTSIPEPLFPGPTAELNPRYYHVLPDGRFLIIEPIGWDSAAKIRVVQNWYKEFRDREQD